MVDHLLLDKTHIRINESLNKRFEKNANLYISKQNEYEVRKHICKEEYGALMDMCRGEKINHQIILRLLIKNACIIPDSENKDLKHTVKKLLHQNENQFIEDLIHQILIRDVYIDDNFREFIILEYFRVQSLELQNLFFRKKEMDKMIECKKKMLLIMLENITDMNKRIETFLNEAKENAAFLSIENIYILMKEGLSEEALEKYLESLIVEVQLPEIADEMYERAIVNGIASYGKAGFDKCLMVLKNESKNGRGYVKAIMKYIQSHGTDSQVVSAFEELKEYVGSKQYPENNRRMVEQRIWRVAQKNKLIMESYKSEIEKELSFRKTRKITCYNDIQVEMKLGTKMNDIIYEFTRLKRDRFLAILMEIYEYDDVKFQLFIRQLFMVVRKFGGDHRQSCYALIAQSLVQYYHSNHTMGFLANISDKLLMEEIKKCKFSDQRINDYLATMHFDEYQEIYG